MIQFTSNKAIQALLDQETNADFFKKLMQHLKDSEAKMNAKLGKKQKVYSELQDQLMLLNIVYDIIRSLSKHLQSDDILLESSVSTDSGSVVYKAKYQRGDITFNISSESILAGGYNIQCLHYRYITHSSIKSTKANAEDLAIIKNEKKRLTKTEELQNEIAHLEKSFKRNQETIEQFKNFSDEEIYNYLLEEDVYTRQQAERKYNPDNHAEQTIEQFNSFQESTKLIQIQWFKNQNLIWPAKYNKSITKTLIKLNKKLEALN